MKNVEQIILDKNALIKEQYRKCVSVSKLCNNIMKAEFDAEKKAHECYLKGLNDPNYKYAGMSEKDILNAWEEKSKISKHYGSLLDDFAELYLTEKHDLLEEWKQAYDFEHDLRLKYTCTGLMQFYSNIIAKTNYRFIARELPLYCSTDTGKINGRFDCLLYDEITDSYIIIDWKTTDNITTKSLYNKHLLGPGYLLDECDMNIYTIQLHVYKKALVETYGLASFDRISVYVCNLLKQPGQDGLLYKLFPQNFPFDINRINSFISYGSMMYKLNNMIKNEKEAC